MSENKLGNEPAFPSKGSANCTSVSGYTSFQNIEFEGMSKREYAAIKLRVPDSGTEWLDEMIRKANRRESAQIAMQGLLANVPTNRQDMILYLELKEKAYGNIPVNEAIAKEAFIIADELQKQESNE